MSEILAAIMGAFVGWLLDQPSKRSERRAKESAERELAAIRSRAQAPFLALSNESFNHLYERGEAGAMGAWSCGAGNVLCFTRQEVDQQVAEGDPVIVVVENLGQACQRVLVKLDGQPIPLCREPDFKGAHGLYFLKYPFHPGLRGREQVMEVWFECSGVQGKHRYRLVHGRRELHRVEPS